MRQILKKQILIKFFLILLFVVGTILSNGAVTYGQMVLENYGNIGTLKTFKGQVRDAAEDLIPLAQIELTNLDSKKEYSIEADENASFLGTKLPSGKYKIRIRMSGFNQTEFTVTLSSRNSSASKKYIVIRLSPGCASGGDVTLEDNLIKDPF